MPMFNVPVERRNLPSTNPLRWLILTVEASGPVEAIRKATHIARVEMRIAGATIWAAVSDIPSFEYMQELRDEMDAIKAGRMARKAKHRDRVANSFNTFSAAAFA